MVNTNCKISFVIYELNSNSLHSRQDGWNCSQCGSRCETRPGKNCWTTVILLRAMGHCWLEMTAVEWNFIAWNAYFTHFSQNFPENLPFHRASQIPQNSTYFTTFFTRETGDLLIFMLVFTRGKELLSFSNIMLVTWFTAKAIYEVLFLIRMLYWLSMQTEIKTVLSLWKVTPTYNSEVFC